MHGCYAAAAAAAGSGPDIWVTESAADGIALEQQKSTGQWLTCRMHRLLLYRTGIIEEAMHPMAPSRCTRHIHACMNTHTCEDQSQNDLAASLFMCESSNAAAL